MCGFRSMATVLGTCSSCMSLTTVDERAKVGDTLLSRCTGNLGIPQGGRRGVVISKLREVKTLLDGYAVSSRHGARLGVRHG